MGSRSERKSNFSSDASRIENQIMVDSSPMKGKSGPSRMPGVMAPAGSRGDEERAHPDRQEEQDEQQALRAAARALVSCRQAIGPAPPRNGGCGNRRRAVAPAVADSAAPLRTRRSRS